MNQSTSSFSAYFTRLSKVFLTLPVGFVLLFATPLFASDYVFINVNVVPMGTEEVHEEYAVVIRDDRIVEVVSMVDFSVPDNAEVIDGGGNYLLPGLAEMHGHVPPQQSDNVPTRYLDDTLLLYLAGGITTVRGMLGHAGQLELIDDIEAGERLGPTLYLAGPSFNGNSVQSVEPARNMVREHKQAGWDLLKIHPGLSLEHFNAIAEEAANQTIDFAGHIPRDVPLETAMAMGIRTIDHMDGYIESVEATDREITDEELQSLVELTLQYEVGVVPTQALWATLIGAADRDALEAYDEVKYVPESVRQGWQHSLDNAAASGYYSGDNAPVHQQNRQRLLLALHQAGAEILMGTDAPQIYSVPGLGLKHELAMMNEAGLTPYEVLYTGTVAVGQYFADQDTFGQIEAGHRADLILTADNPLQDLSTLDRPLGVMARGRWLSRAELDEKLADIEDAYQQ